MAQIFTCKLKESRAGMPRGTTIQVASSFSSPAEYEIADECERRFGKRSRDAQYKGYWEIKKNWLSCEKRQGGSRKSCRRIWKYNQYLFKMQWVKLRSIQNSYGE